MFKFNFSEENDDDSDETSPCPCMSSKPGYQGKQKRIQYDATCGSVAHSVSSPLRFPSPHMGTADGDLQWYPATEIFPTSEHAITVDVLSDPSIFYCGDLALKHVPLCDAITRVQAEDGVVEADLSHSDLLPAKYEGGLKVWECTHDLAEYLMNTPDIHLPGAVVLDLGCGTGLLGILAMTRGSEAHFQDYNASVLNLVTIPNVLLNIGEERRDKCRFFAGDWQSFVELTKPENMKYDLILTSETVYNTNNYHKLLSVFKHRLKQNGVVLLAAKTYYFGVGGGLRQFEMALQSDGVLSSVVCWKHSQGVQREILRIKFAKDAAIV